MSQRHGRIEITSSIACTKSTVFYKLAIAEINYMEQTDKFNSLNALGEKWYNINSCLVSLATLFYLARTDSTRLGRNYSVKDDLLFFLKREFADTYSYDTMKEEENTLLKYIEHNHMEEETYHVLKEQFFQLYNQRFEMFSDNLKIVNFFTELQNEILKEHSDFFIESRVTEALASYVAKGVAESSSENDKVIVLDNFNPYVEFALQFENNSKTEVFNADNRSSSFSLSLDPYAKKLCRSLVYSLNKKVQTCSLSDLEEKSFAGAFTYLNLYPQGIPEWFNRASEHYQTFSKSVKGRFVMFVHNSVTYLSQSEATGFRKRIVKEGHLKAVVNLPKFFTKQVSYPVCAMVFDTEKTFDEVAFIDLSGKDCIDPALSDRQHNVLSKKAATELGEVLAGEKTDHSVVISNKRLENDQCLFDPSCYVAGPDNEESVDYIEKGEITLADVAEIYRAQVCTAAPPEFENYTETVYELNLNDVPQTGIMSEVQKELKIKRGDSRANRSRLMKGDIVLSIKGTIGKVGYFNDNRTDVIAGQCFAVIRTLNEEKYPQSLIFSQLKSKDMQRYLKMKTTGDKIKVLQSKILRQLPIYRNTKNLKAEADRMVQKMLELDRQRLEIKHAVEKSTSFRIEDDSFVEQD